MSGCADILEEFTFLDQLLNRTLLKIFVMLKQNITVSVQLFFPKGLLILVKSCMKQFNLSVTPFNDFKFKQLKDNEHMYAILYQSII